MIDTIDLMPQACRDILNHRMLVRRWVLVCALSATVALGCWWFLTAANRTLREERDAMALKVKINWRRSEVVNGLIDEITRIESAITRYNRLAWPVRATDVVGAITTSVPSEVTVTELSFHAREEKVVATKRPDQHANPNEPKPAPRSILVVSVLGVGVDDPAIARLVSSLDLNPMFGRVTLDFTRAENVAGVDAREFRVTAEIDLDQRYAFVDHIEGGD